MYKTLTVSLWVHYWHVVLFIYSNKFKLQIHFRDMLYKYTKSWIYALYQIHWKPIYHKVSIIPCHVGYQTPVKTFCIRTLNDFRTTKFLRKKMGDSKIDKILYCTLNTTQYINIVYMPLSARSRDTNSFDRKWAFEMFERVFGGGGGG